MNEVVTPGSISHVVEDPARDISVYVAENIPPIAQSSWAEREQKRSASSRYNQDQRRSYIDGWVFRIQFAHKKEEHGEVKEWEDESKNKIASGSNCSQSILSRGILTKWNNKTTKLYKTTIERNCNLNYKSN